MNKAGHSNNFVKWLQRFLDKGTGSLGGYNGASTEK